ncbi:hypothetical protein [Phaeobacter sp. HF9A]|uniref:hypothetical protein n=1 Tax=Phaeobacter sp. HF9A TaxID=2721561 RepID=UPI0014315E7E|nr:hypothetical protein [Phaeobacter sp. HF9A]NIZ12910.1 hypothetical protein [Phaeobacter sp. HF9A]
MALTWPLLVDDFFAGLPIKQISARLGRAQTSSETGGGEVISHAMGTRLWQGQIVLDKESHAYWAALEARLALLEQPGASLLLWDTRMHGTILDPDLSILGASSPVIDDLAANNRELDISGLPANYEISQGDLLGFTYGANPTRYAYHRVVTGDRANLSGVARNIEVIPYIRPGAQIGAAVTLGTPVLKAVISNADYGQSRATLSDGGSFEWVQTLR